MGSTDAMRYPGRRVPASGEVRKNFRGKVVSHPKQPKEGVRIKHTLNGNSVKLYDEAFTATGACCGPKLTCTTGMTCASTVCGKATGDAGLPICTAEPEVSR